MAIVESHGVIWLYPGGSHPLYNCGVIVNCAAVGIVDEEGNDHVLILFASAFARYLTAGFFCFPQ